MKIRVAIQSYKFNKRLCWMLSSILQQTGDLPDIEVSVSYFVNTGVKELLCVFRRAGLLINGHEYVDWGRFKRRGFVRNRDLKIGGVRVIDADWILWADSDMVYPPNFFSMMKSLCNTTFADNLKCLHSGRRSTFLDETELLVNKYNYPCIVPNAFIQANKLKSKKKRNIGAGYCQITNVDSLFSNFGGIYVKGRCDRDWDTRGQKAISDIRFRKRLGAEKIPLPWQVHLQHLRSMPNERDC